VTDWAGLVLTHGVLALCGGAAAWHPALRRTPLLVRTSAALACGTLALAVEAILWALLGIPWTTLTLALPLAGVSCTLALLWARTATPCQHPALGPSRPIALVAAGIALGALAHFALAALTSLGSASDLVLFWGVKGLHFAAAGGPDPATLAGAFAAHTHPSYPPLYPVLLAWWTLLAGALPWRLVPVASSLYLAAALPLVYHLLRRACPPDLAAGVTALWATALSAALVQARSAGNAEPLLLLFVTVAVTALLTEPQPPAAVPRWTAALALSGAVLTKNEGAVAAVLLVGGVMLRDRLWRRRPAARALLGLAWPPLAAWTLWLVLRLVCGLPLTDPIREPALVMSFAHVGTILAAASEHLGAGSRGLAWLVPLAVLAVRCRGQSLVRVVPALVLGGGLPAFLFVYYLHAVGDPSQLIDWTFPRVTLPALSALIIAAGVATALPEAAPRPGDETWPPRSRLN